MQEGLHVSQEGLHTEKQLRDPRHFARGGSSDSSDEDMASCDGDIDCRSDEDEDDGRSPVYATRSSAHGVKQPTLTGNDITVIYLILRPRLT